MHPNVIHVASVLRELGVPGEVRELPEPAPTAATGPARDRAGRAGPSEGMPRRISSAS
jgi:hypothetical protein